MEIARVRDRDLLAEICEEGKHGACLALALPWQSDLFTELGHGNAPLQRAIRPTTLPGFTTAPASFEEEGAQGKLQKIGIPKKSNMKNSYSISQ